MQKFSIGAGAGARAKAGPGAVIGSMHTLKDEAKMQLGKMPERGRPLCSQRAALLHHRGADLL